ncbi:MAG TPA: fatty acid desaturase [Chitinophagaceae bacterium]
MKALPVINDPVFEPRSYNWVDRQLLRLIKDKRDLPFVYLVIRISSIVFPVAVLLYTPLLSGWLWALTAVAYQVINFYFRAPFGLMMHCISHRPLFKRQYRFLHRYIIWIMCPFMGHTPETYFSHHMGMHHAENNMPEDDSSTMMYQRDSLKDFLKYLGHFLALGFKGLMDYLFSRKKRKLAYNAMKGEFSFFAFCIVMSFVNLPATMAVFVVTFFISRMIMMVGNWTQHSFIDPADPANPYRNCITTLNVNYNKRCWNDGYHSSHHARPALHWTEHPKFFMDNLDQYASNKAIVFDKLDFGGVFVCLMTKNYPRLAAHLVNVNGVFKSDEEVIAILKERARRFPEEILHSSSVTAA